MKLPRAIGVIHLPPLVGSPKTSQIDPSAVLQRAGVIAVQEAIALAKAGFDGVILENFGDAPFYRDRVPPETVASLAIISAAVREAVRIQVGVNVLRNDARSALAIASVTGCDFIRVNILSGITATDQGFIEGESAYILRERERLQSSVKILADVHVKHGITLSSNDLALAIEEVKSRSMADGVIVTGVATGKILEISELKIASRAAKLHKIPLFIGSGLTCDILKEVKPLVDGVIIGSFIRKGGIAGNPLDAKRIKDFVQELKKSKTNVPDSGRKAVSRK